MGLKRILLMFLLFMIISNVCFSIGISYDGNGSVTNIKSISGTTGTVYQYDLLNRLVHVEDGQAMTADYTYDPLGRRLLKKVNHGGAIENIRYVWDGWQVIEERDGSGNLQARYTYGNGLDEPVEIERKDPATGNMKSYVPLQDTNGNVLGMADAAGNLIEKVSYTPYGGATFIYDHKQPNVDNVLVDGTGYEVEGGRCRVRFSEEVNEQSAREAINIKQGVTALSGSIAFAEEGRLALFTPSSPLPQNELLTISISTELSDKFENKLASAFSQDFTYTGVDIVVYDRVAPEVEKIIYESGKFKVEFAEEIDAASIANSVELKSGNMTISGSCTLQGEKVVVFTPNQTLNSGSVNIKPVIRDLAGKTTAAFNVDYDLSSGDTLIYKRPKENEHNQSYIKNTTLFQGREYDQDAGLYYFRARYYDPALGRFMQTDPIGYWDSMNLYQSLNQNPVNFIDPNGLIIGYKCKHDEKVFKKALDILKMTTLGLFLYNKLEDDSRIFYLIDNNNPKTSEGGGSFVVENVTKDKKDFTEADIFINYKNIKNFSDTTISVNYDLDTGYRVPQDIIDIANKNNINLEKFLSFKGLEDADHVAAEMLGHEFSHAFEAIKDPEKAVKRKMTIDDYIRKRNNCPGFRIPKNCAECKNYNEMKSTDINIEEAKVAYPNERIIYEELLKLIEQKRI